MGKKPDRRKFYRRRQRAGFALFSSLVIVILGGMLFFGVDTARRAAGNPMERVQIPESAAAPEAVADLEAEAKEAAAKKAAAEEKAAKEKAAKEEAAKKEKAKAGSPAIPEPPTTDMYLTVPKMGRYDDYVNNTTDQSAMDYGAIKLPETGFPWQNGANTYIAAHVLGYSGTGSYLQFANLPSMTYGDKIYMTDANGTTYTYEVSEVLTVTPQDNWVTNPIAGRNMITLQTCINPPAYDLRFIVRADRVSVEKA